MADLSNIPEIIDDETLSQVTGGEGSDTGYQLYYNGTALDMTKTVGDLMTEYGISNPLLNSFKSRTLNEICAQYGEATVQAIIDANS